jgi:prepilin-type N-terminal cleavage/methylation domain-containing protein
MNPEKTLRIGNDNFFCASLRGVRRSKFGIRDSEFTRAFTLIEIMVAVTILTLLLAAIYSSWMLILRATKVGGEATAQVQRQRMALRTIEDALTCAESFQASIQYYTFIVQNGSEPLLSFAARLPDDFPRNGRFGGFNSRRVTVTVEAGPNLERDLVLRQSPILMDMDEDEQNHPLVLARNVKSFAVECWDTNTVDWADRWDYTNQIPPMVRFTLVLGGNKNGNNFSGIGPELTVTRVVAFPSGTVPVAAQTQSAPAGTQPGINNSHSPNPFGSFHGR